MDFWLKILSYTLPAGRLFGIRFRINWLVLLVVGFMLAPYVRAAQEGAGGWALALGFGFVFIVYGSIVLHELGHAWGSRLVGRENTEIQLTPLGGVAMSQGEMHGPKSELIVVALGPAVTVLLAGLGFAAAKLFGDMLHPVAYALVLFAASFNTGLAIFNLCVPVFPLDSAKLLRAGLSLKLNPEKATYYVAQLGMGLAVLMLVAGLFGFSLPVVGQVGPWLMLIAILGFQACAWELLAAQHGRIYSRSDSWGGRTVYYDSEVMAGAKRRAAEDVRGVVPPFLRKGARKPAAPAPRAAGRREEPAKIVEVIPAPETLTDPAEVRRFMLMAADREDFKLAGALKRRLKELGAE